MPPLAAMQAERDAGREKRNQAALNWVRRWQHLSTTGQVCAAVFRSGYLNPARPNYISIAGWGRRLQPALACQIEQLVLEAHDAV